MISDHFQPWRHVGGHAPNALACLAAIGERTERIVLGTSVLTPTFRYNPAIARPEVRHPRPCSTPTASSSASAPARRSTRCPSASPSGRTFKERFARLREAVRADARPLDRRAGHLRGRLLPHRRRHDLRPARGRRFRSTSRPAGRWWPSTPAGSATASSAPAARAWTSTPTSCCPPSSTACPPRNGPSTRSTG